MVDGGIRRMLLALVLATAAPVGACSRVCTAVSCGPASVLVLFKKQRKLGQYLVEVTVDGERSQCSVEALTIGTKQGECDASYLILLAGSDGLRSLGIARSNAETVTIVVRWNGVFQQEQTFTPNYVVTRPGPNGPGCDPESCTSASHEL